MLDSLTLFGRWTGAGCLGALLALGACSADSGGSTGPAGNVPTSGGTSSGGSGGSGTSGSSAGGSTAQGGSGASAQGGTLNVDAGGGSGGFNQDAACQSVAETATNQFVPNDIIIAVDNSGSMDEEALFTQSAMNLFGMNVPPELDAHVILISATSSQENGICVPGPLGSGACPQDTNLPGFIHVGREVGSSNSFDIILQEFVAYKQHLRPGSFKHVVVVSDDNSSLSSSAFDSQFTQLLVDDNLGSDYIFHAIYGFTEPDDAPFIGDCALTNGADPCCFQEFPGVWDTYTAEVGTNYRDLAQLKGGQQGNLCLQESGFVTTFTAITQQIVSGTTLACEWLIPNPPSGETLDPNLVNVEFTPEGGAPESIGRVDSAADCGGVVDGWYYDNASNPTKIFVCDQTCARIQAATNATMDIQFGCATEIAIPK